VNPRRTAAVRAASTVAFVAVGLIVLTAWPANAAPAEWSAAVCPEAPPGVQAFADQVTAWVKWGVLALIGIAAVVSLGSVLVGRMFSHPHASRYGAMGVAVVVMVAITYTVILVILGSITGSGCT
jgi:hypothetical protein